MIESQFNFYICTWNNIYIIVWASKQKYNMTHYKPKRFRMGFWVILLRTNLFTILFFGPYIHHISYGQLFNLSILDLAYVLFKQLDFLMYFKRRLRFSVFQQINAKRNCKWKFSVNKYINFISDVFNISWNNCAFRDIIYPKCNCTWWFILVLFCDF